MISLTTTFTCAFIFILFHHAVVNSVSNSGVEKLLCWIFYYCVSEYVERRGWTHMPSWRVSRFARFVRRFLSIRLAPSSVARLSDIVKQTVRPTIYMLGPHGMACFHMIFGFAAPGSEVGECGLSEADVARIWIVAHPIYKIVPIVRNIYACFGVIGGKTAVRQALERGDSLAVTPCGFEGKHHSLLNGPGKLSPEFTYTIHRPNLVETRSNFDSDYHVDGVFIVRPEINRGIFQLAMKFNSRLVHVLSPDEDCTFQRLNRGFGLTSFVITLGPWIYGQCLPVLEYHVGDAYFPDYSSKPSVDSITKEATTSFVDLGRQLGYSVIIVSTIGNLDALLMVEKISIFVLFLASLLFWEIVFRIAFN